MEISIGTFNRIIRSVSKGVDWEGIALYYAQKDPEEFVKVLNEYLQTWELAAREMESDGKTKAEVVKYIRNETGRTLKESIQWVKDNLSYTFEDDDASTY